MLRVKRSLFRNNSACWWLEASTFSERSALFLFRNNRRELVSLLVSRSVYRFTSLIRKRTLIGTYGRPMPRAL